MPASISASGDPSSAAIPKFRGGHLPDADHGDLGNLQRRLGVRENHYYYQRCVVFEDDVEGVRYHVLCCDFTVYNTNPGPENGWDDIEGWRRDWYDPDEWREAWDELNAKWQFKDIGPRETVTLSTSRGVVWRAA